MDLNAQTFYFWRSFVDLNLPSACWRNGQNANTQYYFAETLALSEIILFLVSADIRYRWVFNRNVSLFVAITFTSRYVRVAEFNHFRLSNGMRLLWRFGRKKNRHFTFSWMQRRLRFDSAPFSSRQKKKIEKKNDCQNFIENAPIPMRVLCIAHIFI